jgi:hypothetical protein
LSIGPVNLGFGAAGTSDVVGSEHEQHVEFVHRLPVASKVVVALEALGGLTLA